MKKVPTLSAPSSPQTAIVRKTNVVHYKQNRYEVPKGTYFPGRQASISVDEEKGIVSFCDNKYEEIKGKVLNAFPESADYIESLINKYPRYAKDQLRILNNCTVQYNKEELLNALEYCTTKELISANDFRDTLEFFRYDEPRIISKKMKLPEK